MNESSIETAHVLLIEDSEDLRGRLVQILKSSREAFSIEAISSSAGIMSKLRDCEIDVLVLDYDLEAGDAASIIRTAKDIDPFLPVVLISKDFSDTISDESASIGADVYITLTEISPKVLPMILMKRIESKALLREAIDSRRQSTLKSFQLEILSSLVRKMIETQDLKSVMQELAEQIVKKLDMKAASLQRYFKSKNGFAVYGIYPQGKFLRFVERFFDISSEDFTFPFDPVNCIVDQYTAARKPWVGYDFADVFGTTMPSMPARMIQKFTGVESIYNAPFYSSDELLGGIIVGNVRKRFTNEELEAFSAIVHISSLLFEYNESVNSQIIQNRKLKAIHEISIQLHENLDTNNLFEGISEKLNRLIPSDLVRLYLFDKGENVLHVERALSKKGENSFPPEIPIGKGLIGKAAAERRSILENDSHKNVLSYHVGDMPKQENLLAVPVIHGDELLGMIAMTRWHTHRFKESDLMALEIFSSQFAVALHNSILYDKLSRSESLYRLVLQNVNDAVILVGDDRRILYVNPQFLKITGYEPEEVMGREFDFLIYSGDKQIVERNYTDWIMGKPAPDRYEFRFLKKSGEIRIAEYNVASVQSGERITGLLGIARDVTEDRMAKGTGKV
jgi:PAS domain S-box-containing protein